MQRARPCYPPGGAAAHLPSAHAASQPAGRHPAGPAVPAVAVRVRSAATCARSNAGSCPRAAVGELGGPRARERLGPSATRRLPTWRWPCRLPLCAAYLLVHQEARAIRYSLGRRGPTSRCRLRAGGAAARGRAANARSWAALRAASSAAAGDKAQTAPSTAARGSGSGRSESIDRSSVLQIYNRAKQAWLAGCYLARLVAPIPALQGSARGALKAAAARSSRVNRPPASCARSAAHGKRGRCRKDVALRSLPVLPIL